MNDVTTPLQFRYTRGNRTLGGVDDSNKGTTDEREIGMKLANVRIGEKFVFDDRGGVWEKIAEGKARCFFGPREMWNKEIEIPAEGFCYIPSFDPRHKAIKDETSDVRGNHSVSGTRVRIVDEENECLLKEIERASADQVVVLSAMELLRLTPPGKKTPREYDVSECRYDMDDETFYVIVTPEEGSNDKAD